MSQQSQPYGPTDTEVYTTYTYDALGRTVKVLLADGASYTTYTYQGNFTTVVDPAGKWKQYANDALGNLVTVLEPDPAANPGPPVTPPAYPVTAAPTGMLLTSYTYDQLNHLTQVAMPRNTAKGMKTQTRTFVYDPTTQRLTSATNPENGTVSYTYNADSTLASKTDANGNTETYTYDAYQRLTGIPDRGQSFTYDTCPLGITVCANAPGQLMEAAFTSGSGLGANQLSLQYYYSYTPAGKVASKSLMLESANHLGATGTLTATYGYDGLGRADISAISDQPDLGERHVQHVHLHAGRAGAAHGDDGQHTEDVGVRRNVQRGESAAVRRHGHADLQQPAADDQHRGERAEHDLQLLGDEERRADRVERGRHQRGDDHVRLRCVEAAQRREQQRQLVGGIYFRRLRKPAGDRRERRAAVHQPDSGGECEATCRPTRFRRRGHVRQQREPDGGIRGVDVQLRQRRTGWWEWAEAHAEAYAYDSSNLRVYGRNASGAETIYFYGVDGKKLATYTYAIITYGGGPEIQLTQQSANVYFLGKLISAEGNAVQVDRLGSVRSGGPGGLGHQAQYPYGVEYSTTANDREKYATYTRDSVSGLDYAMNRYYTSQWGRFTSPDPYGGSANPGSPQSLNRYSYANGDPVHDSDPSGLDGVCGPNGTWMGEGCYDYAGGGSVDIINGYNNYVSSLPGGASGLLPSSQGDGTGIWSNAPDCGFGYGTFCVMWPLLPDTPAPQPPPSKPSPPQITLSEIGDCAYPKGTKGTPFWTLEVEYQVLANGLPAVGLSTVAGDGVSMITESITNASFPVTGGGVWCTPTYTACPNSQAIGELTAQGTFWDGLAGNGTENQGFLLNGTQPLSVINYGGATVFQNVLNSLRRTILVGNGAVVGNSKTRECGAQTKDPEP